MLALAYHVPPAPQMGSNARILSNLVNFIVYNIKLIIYTFSDLLS
jgi:hypothetical protein